MMKVGWTQVPMEELEGRGSCTNTLILSLFVSEHSQLPAAGEKGARQLSSISKEVGYKREPASSWDHRVGGHETMGRR